MELPKLNHVVRIINKQLDPKLSKNFASFLNDEIFVAYESGNPTLVNVMLSKDSNKEDPDDYLGSFALPIFPAQYGIDRLLNNFHFTLNQNVKIALAHLYSNNTNPEKLDEIAKNIYKIKSCLEEYVKNTDPRMKQDAITYYNRNLELQNYITNAGVVFKPIENATDIAQHTFNQLKSFFNNLSQKNAQSLRINNDANLSKNMENQSDLLLNYTVLRIVQLARIRYELNAENDFKYLDDFELFKKIDIRKLIVMDEQYDFIKDSEQSVEILLKLIQDYGGLENVEKLSPNQTAPANPRDFGNGSGEFDK